MHASEKQKQIVREYLVSDRKNWLWEAYVNAVKLIQGLKHAGKIKKEQTPNRYK